MKVILRNNNIKVFTDGSKTQEACGYAVISNNETLASRRINSISSIYTAEIRAIIQAIKIYNQGSLPVEICTDSLSSITAAQNSLCKEAGAVRLRNLLHAAGGKISLTWTPAHSGIIGNEMADTAAKAALESPVDGREPLAVMDITRFTNQQFATPKRHKVTGLTRRQQVAISRVKMGYTRRTHRHVIEK
jgi:ribonuclease HI